MRLRIALSILLAIAGTAAGAGPEQPKARVIRAGDQLRIVMHDLQGRGVKSVLGRSVDTAGRIDLPYVRRVKAAGLTPDELEDAIRNAYQAANIFQNLQLEVEFHHDIT